jgi:C-terminal processing protease CtpA/Prc
MDLLGGFIPLYLLGIIGLLPMFTAKRRIGHRIMLVPVTLLTVLCGLYYCASAPNFFNYSSMRYTESFRAAVKTMDEYYVLKEWKEVDFAALEAKYLPAVEAAEREQNPAKFEEAVTSFCNELHDGHVWVGAGYDFDAYNIDEDKHGFGLATIRTDSGEVIAINTEESVQALGIQDGTVLTKWGGKPIAQAIEENVPDLGEPVKTNDDFLRAMNVCLTGGESVEVSFLDESGAEKTVTLPALDNMLAHHSAFRLFARRPSYDTDEELYAENFSAKMLDDKCGYLRLIAEETDNGVQDTLGYLTGNHKWAREVFRARLNELKSQGMQYLVVDLRGNMGGLDEIGCALCDLLTDREWFGQGLGIRKNGQYTCVSPHGIRGTGEFADLPVVALTNYECASAGDGTSLYLSKLPNVTLAGITDPCGCNQETGGMCVLSGGVVSIGFPTGLIVDENSVPNVETKADRISRNPVEVRIPFDTDAALKIFRDGEDYELDWAVDYLEKQ